MERSTALQTLGLSTSATPGEQLEAYAREKARLDRLAAQAPDDDLSAKIAQSRALLETAWQALQPGPQTTAAPKPTDVKAKPPSTRKWRYAAAMLTLVVLALFAWEGIEVYRDRIQRQQDAERLEGEKELALAREEIPRLLAGIAEKLNWCETQKEVVTALRQEADEITKRPDASLAEHAWIAKRIELFAHFMAKARQLTAGFDLAREQQSARQCLDRGDRREVTALFHRLRALKLPSDEEIVEAYNTVYEKPLITFCQSDGELLKLLRDVNPEAAEEALKSLRAQTTEIAKNSHPTADQLKPALVLSAVVSADDPEIRQLTKAVPAFAYLENPDAKTWPLLHALIEADSSRDFEKVREISSEVRAMGGLPCPVFLRTEALAILAAFESGTTTTHYSQQAWERKLAAEDQLAVAARAGDEIAIRRLGVWLARWKARDELPALPWLEKAAALGDEPAGNELLNAYLQNEDPRAFALLRAKLDAAPENAALIFELAQLTEKGIGTTSSPQDALKLYYKAESLGEERAVPEIFSGIKDYNKAYSYALAQVKKRQPPLSAKICDVLLARAPIDDSDLAAKCYALTIASLERHPEEAEHFGKCALELAQTIAYQESMEQHLAADAMFADLVQRRISGASADRSILRALHNCEKCDGSGRTPGRADCEDCGGNGKIGCSRCDHTGTDTIFQRTCNRCDGTGYIKCSACSGRGWKRTSETCSTCEGSGNWSWLNRPGLIPEFKPRE
ncbi:MAG: hypothetical protein QM715_17240 [Nibricoccus sp.]